MEHFLESSNICLLNDKSHTYFHPASGSFTSIDLSLCSTSAFLDFTYQSILISVVVTISYFN